MADGGLNRAGDKAQVRFRRRLGLLGSETYVLESGELHITRRTSSETAEWAVSLRYLDPLPVWREANDSRCGWVGVLLCIAAVGFALAGLLERDPDAGWALSVMGALWLVGALLSLTVFFLKRTRMVVFAIQTGPPLEIRYRRAESEAAQTFADAVTERATELRDRDEGGTLAAEIKSLADLRDKGLLTEAEYSAAKARLLDAEQWDSRDIDG